MNAIDGMFNYVSGFLEKVATWIPSFSLPWDTLTEKWAVIEPYLQQANIIMPISDLLIIAGLIVSFLAIMLILWGIKFLKSFIPFLG